MKKELDKESKEYLKKLGTRISELRNEKGWTQTDLAEKLDTEYPQIGRAERGETNMSIITLRRIAKIFKISVSELIKIE